MSGFLSAFEHLLEHYGALALFITVTLEALGAPLPGESAIIAAASAAAAGKLSITWVAIAAFVGAVLGDNIGYMIGRDLGRPVIVKYGRRVGITDATLDRAEAIVRRRGPIIVVAARFIILLRQLNGIVAGTTGMRWSHFFAANVVGAALWVGLWTVVAYRLGREADVLPWIWHHLGTVAAIAVPLLILVLLAVRLADRRRARK